ncbi:hypothetical protein NDU88_005810 [Pleurodeles waltl]|uniref:Uncharacterized protein n=1 Tax=Pleurodeles waltl TaxID=8319 RepID=A0AAV7QM33_PLEWA|nr:hypothetical protein NDU88_005810 [Pleurodeles waltl]
MEKGSEVEESQSEKPENAAKKMTNGSTPKRIRGAISTEGGARQSQGETQNSTSGAGGAQQEFQPRFRRSVAFPGTATEKGSEVEESQSEKPENAAKKTTTGSSPKQIRGAISTEGGAGQSQGETQNSTSGE